MKNTVRVISFMLCLVILLGCITVQADDDYYQIKSDYVVKIETGCSIDEVFIKADYGNHSGYDIVVMGVTGRLVPDVTGSLLVGGITFSFGNEADIGSFYAYKDGEFIPVKDAFDAGLLSKADIYNIAVEKGDIKLPIYREIYSYGGITMTLEETSATLYISGEGRTDDYDPTYVVGGLGLENFSPIGLNSSIKRVVVEEGISYLGEFLFCECRGIETVELPSTLEEISDWCFNRCTNITHVVFPEGIKRIGDFCFEIDSLKTLTFCGNLPKSKEYPVFKFFEGTVYYPGNNPTWTKEFMEKYKDITWESWSAPKIKSVSNRFEDVSKNAWYTEGIQYCYDRDVVAGMTYSAFEPNGTLTRAQFVQMLAMYDGVDLTKYKSSNYDNGNGWYPTYQFTDVRYDAWYTPALNWAREQGIVSGMTETTFAPNQPVTREHIATFFRMYVKSKELYDDEVKGDLSVYEDAPKPNQWSYGVMQWAVGSGLISGTSAVTLSPRSTATRAQACRMIMNLDAYFEGGEIEYKGGAYNILKNFIAENGEYGKGYFPDNYVYTVK
ncbi:MAG: S-layer homology domain-containing protein, partial [Clostridia bacterium]|nr:S-layer homology domain-containing protein [Clostridia bacterium]